MSFVSIIMRSKNDIKYIKQTLDAIYKQTFTDFELINVDSGSTDGTYQIIQEYNNSAYQILPEEYIPGKVLNEAIKKAKGDIIVFNNSDCIPQNDHWLENLITPLINNKKIIATFGQQIPRKDASPLVVKDYMRAFGSGKISSKWDHFFSLATSAVKAEYIKKYPFDDKIQYSEDVEWSNRMIKQGEKIVYVPNSIVEHSHNYTLKEVKKRFYEEGVADAKIFGKMPQRMSLWSGKIRPIIAETIRDWLYLVIRLKLLTIFHAPIYRFIQKSSTYKGYMDHIRSTNEG